MKWSSSTPPDNPQASGGAQAASERPDIERYEVGESATVQPVQAASGEGGERATVTRFGENDSWVDVRFWRDDQTWGKRYVLPDFPRAALLEEAAAYKAGMWDAEARADSLATQLEDSQAALHSGECSCGKRHYPTGMAGTDVVMDEGAPQGPDCRPLTWKDEAEQSRAAAIARRNEGRVLATQLRDALDAARTLASYTQGFAENETVQMAKETIERLTDKDSDG